MAAKSGQYSNQLSNVSVVYNIYRIVLPLILLVTYISTPGTTIFGTVDLTLFVQVCTAYATFGVGVTFTASAYPRLGNNSKFLAATLIVDILALSLLIYSCGGIASGLGVLLIVTVASGSILVRGRMSAFLAAIATLCIIYSEVYLSFVLNDPPDQFLQAGILGTVLFATSIYIHSATDRVYKAALLADEQATSIVELERLNNEVIQRMRMGIIVVNANFQIVTMNSAARMMLQPIMTPEQDEGSRARQLPLILAERLSAWRREKPGWQDLLDIPNSGTRIQINFTLLDDNPESDILIFLEDNSLIMHRVQQMKLAALGRLTASIAHEIRNPLGAISHASQLLKESPSIVAEDKRMTEIILSHCDRVNKIIEHVLDVSRYREIAPTTIQMKAWLEKYIASYLETHKDCNGIDLKMESENVSVKVIPSQLEQILDNLIDNGLRYSRKATGKATVEIHVGETVLEGESRPFLQVIDAGPVLDPAAESQLFEPFHTTEPTGTGLGLYISRELCEANHASLFYSASKHGTSCFRIDFSNPYQTVT